MFLWIKSNVPLSGIALLVLGILLGPANAAQQRPAPRRPAPRPVQPSVAPGGAGAQAEIRYKGI
jgi:hypothetical protein